MFELSAGAKCGRLPLNALVAGNAVVAELYQDRAQVLFNVHGGKVIEFGKPHAGVLLRVSPSDDPDAAAAEQLPAYFAAHERVAVRLLAVLPGGAACACCARLCGRGAARGAAGPDLAAPRPATVGGGADRRDGAGVAAERSHDLRLPGAPGCLAAGAARPDRLLRDAAGASGAAGTAGAGGGAAVAGAQVAGRRCAGARRSTGCAASHCLRRTRALTGLPRAHPQRESGEPTHTD